MNFRLRAYKLLMTIIQRRFYLINNRKSYNGIMQVDLDRFRTKVIHAEDSLKMAALILDNEAFIRTIPHPLHKQTLSDLEDIISEAFHIREQHNTPDQNLNKNNQLTLNL